MTVSSRPRPGRLALALALAICVLAAAPGAARAGTYDVVACDAAPGGANNSWTGTATGPMSTGTACPTAQAPQRGMWAAAKVDAGQAPPFAAATQSFDAPPGASIVSLSAQFGLHRKANFWQVGIFADGRMLLGCPANVNDLCLYTTAWPGAAQTWAFSQGVHRVYAQTACGSGTGCPTGPADVAPFFDRAGIRLYAATVRVRDDTAPSVWDTHSGALTNGAWQRGSHYAGYGASDNVGIRTTRLYVDDRQRDDLAGTCDFTRRAPCGNLPSSRYLFDTRTLADGPHQLRIQAVDTAGNQASMTASFNSDNTPPDAPAAVSVDGGEGWRATNSFRLSWDSPASAAPISVAHYELCDAATGDCVSGEQRGEGIEALAGLALPHPGDYTARVWLEDAAGNVNDGNRSVPVHLRFDDVPPGQASPVAHDRWSNAVELDQVIEMGVGQTVPVSGVAGYSVTTDGTDPDATIDSQGGSYRLTALHEGVTRLRARAVSGSGVPSLFVGETAIRIDRTPPTAAAAGIPAAGGWQRQPVTLHLSGADQAGLSGMTPAAPEEPPESGGHLAYRLDGGDPQRARGATADVTIADDGEHAVSFTAVDAAGNESGEQTVRVRVDRTAPELVVFEQPDPADPRTVRVAAADRTSGVAGGVIEVRRAGSAERWQALATSTGGGRLVAQIDDSVLSGAYELRARVVDRAGNETVGDRRRDGSPAIVDAATLRVATRLTAGIVSPAASSRTGSAPLSAATVGFGRRATARGTLVRAGGAPIAGAVVGVYSRPSAAGATFGYAGRARTDAAGGFGYTLPAGTSRTLRFEYAGSALHRPSRSDVTVRVPASATIRASRRSVRNGRTVTFSGRVRSRPIPRGGKVVDLQAFYRGMWRTFATPRAASNGLWRYTYRFGATRGRLVYRFRLKVRPESAYPYELGYSKETSVTVSG